MIHKIISTSSSPIRTPHDIPVMDLLVTPERVSAFEAFCTLLRKVSSQILSKNINFFQLANRTLGTAQKPYPISLITTGIKSSIEHTKELQKTLNDLTESPGNIVDLAEALTNADESTGTPTISPNSQTLDLAKLSINELQLQVYGDYVVAATNTFKDSLNLFYEHFCTPTPPIAPLEFATAAESLITSFNQFINQLMTFGIKQNQLQKLNPDTPQLLKKELIDPLSINLFNVSMAIFKRFPEFNAATQALFLKPMMSMFEKLSDVFPESFDRTMLAEVVTEYFYRSNISSSRLTYVKTLEELEGYPLLRDLIDELSESKNPAVNNLLKSLLSILRRMKHTEDRDEHLAHVCGKLSADVTVDPKGRFDAIAIMTDVYLNKMIKTCSTFKISQKLQDKDKDGSKETAFYDSTMLLLQGLINMLDTCAKGPSEAVSEAGYKEEYTQLINKANLMLDHLLNTKMPLSTKDARSLDKVPLGLFPRHLNPNLAISLFEMISLVITKVVDSFKWPHIPEEMKLKAGPQSTALALHGNIYDHYLRCLEQIKAEFASKERQGGASAAASSQAESVKREAQSKEQSKRFSTLLKEETAAAKASESRQRKADREKQEAEISQIRQLEEAYDKKVEEARLSGLTLALPINTTDFQVTPQGLHDLGVMLMRSGNYPSAKTNLEQALTLLESEAPNPALACLIHLNLIELYLVPANRNHTYPHQEMTQHITFIKANYSKIADPSIKESIKTALGLIVEGLAIIKMRIQAKIDSKIAILEEKNAEFQRFKAAHPEKFTQKRGVELSTKSQQRLTLKESILGLTRQKEALEANEKSIQEIGNTTQQSAKKGKPKKK
jgi:hypothetical protein